VIGSINGEHYDAKSLELNSRGQFNAADIDRAFVGHGRKTSAIVNNVVEQSRSRKGVLLYAATVAHAYEILASLPKELSAIITGETPAKERADIIARFKSQKIKYLVNRDVLTTGFDAPHVDVIALLRATESESLLQQIVGRGMRLSPDKENFLVLDYAENIERHCPDGDLFNPDVKVRGGDSEAGELEVHCPLCSTINSFTARPNPENYDVTKDGYFSLHGGVIEIGFGDKKYPLPSHFGRRCFGEHKDGSRCEYRWSAKECPECGGDNDIAARYCSHCKAELIDPNEKLIADFVAAKKDPENVQTDKVLSFSVSDHITQKGESWKKITVQTEYRSFRVFMNPNRKEYAKVIEVTHDGKKPYTVTYRKEKSSTFFKILAFNLPEDVAPNAK
jgi:DNA repair protein RadD